MGRAVAIELAPVPLPGVPMFLRQVFTRLARIVGAIVFERRDHESRL